MAKISKKDIEAQLKGVGFSDRFVELWWILKLPMLNGLSPEELYKKDPVGLLQYVMDYEVSNEGVA